MKSNFRKLFFTICFLSAFTAFSQDVVTITIDQIKVNNTSIQTDSPIDLGSNTSKNVNFRIKLSKPSAFEVGS
jgi:hypothetical protein